jgi:hypothetical protein
MEWGGCWGWVDAGLRGLIDVLEQRKKDHFMITVKTNEKLQPRTLIDPDTYIAWTNPECISTTTHYRSSFLLFKLLWVRCSKYNLSVSMSCSYIHRPMPFLSRSRRRKNQTTYWTGVRRGKPVKWCLNKIQTHEIIFNATTSNNSPVRPGSLIFFAVRGCAGCAESRVEATPVNWDRKDTRSGPYSSRINCTWSSGRLRAKIRRHDRANDGAWKLLYHSFDFLSSVYRRSIMHADHSHFLS